MGRHGPQAILDRLAPPALRAHRLLTWSLIEAARVPGLLERLAGANGARGTLDGVLAETLRLHPPFYLLMRQTTAAERFHGQMLPPGAHLAISPWLLHRDPRSYRTPEAFDPERFTGTRPPPGAYLPFGLGPRGCPGRQLATVMVAALWRALLSRGRLAVDAGQVRERPSAALDIEGRVALRLERHRPG